MLSARGMPCGFYTRHAFRPQRNLPQCDDGVATFWRPQEDGICVSGPCEGEFLTHLPVHIATDEVGEEMVMLSYDPPSELLEVYKPRPRRRQLQRAAAVGTIVEAEQGEGEGAVR